MLVPVPRPAAPAAAPSPVIPEGGCALAAGARLFRGPAAGREEVDTARGPVLLRPVSPLDADAVDRFVRALSDTSRFRRFHGGMARLTPAQLAGVVDVDHVRRESLVAVAGRRVIGLAQYVEVPAGDAVDLAVVVADRWQRQGLGRRLLEAVAEAAAASGYGEATAYVQADNAPVLHLLRSLGHHALLVREGRAVEARLRLRPPG